MRQEFPVDPLDLILHVGSGKTGTTSIQHFLHRNRRRLAEEGLLYPRAPGLQRHVRLGLFLRPNAEVGARIQRRYDGYSSPAEFRENFERELFAEVEQSGLRRLLLSDETLYASTPQTLRRIRRFTDRIAGRVRVVVYLRRQDDHLVSRYQQLVKTGERRRLATYLQQADLTDTYDHEARLRRWQRVVGPERLVVRPFERGDFVGGSLLEDFMQAADLRVRAADLEQVEYRNVSMDAEGVEFVRLINIYRVAHEGAVPHRIDNEGLGRRLARHASGPTLTLPEDTLDRFMARWQEPNAAVARAFVGREELFTEPRKVRSTTTVQHLDPARVDHFLALGRVPERAHRELRRIAEREAAQPA